MSGAHDREPLLPAPAILPPHPSSVLPGLHASTHYDGGSDELDVTQLGSGAAVAGKLLETDGAGGLILVSTIDGGTF